MSIRIEHLGITVQFAYDEESAIGVWQVEPIVKETGPCQHALILYSDGDVALAHTENDHTRFEYFGDGSIQSMQVMEVH